MKNNDEIRHAATQVMPQWARDNKIVVGIRGSHAHGTFIPPEEKYGTDDVDVFAITVQPSDWYLGLESFNPNRKDKVHFETAGDEIDVLVYDIRKFCHLLVKGNPNVHSWLWSPDDCYVYQGYAFQYLMSEREKFLSQRLLDATAGYARGQLHRMTHFVREGYMGEKRKKLVEDHGYDVKNAAHCIRLLNQGIHLAKTGKVKVRWGGVELQILKSIKRGEYSLAEVRSHAGFLFDIFDAAKKDNLLPRNPDKDCSQIVVNTIKWKNDIWNHEVYK